MLWWLKLWIRVVLKSSLVTIPFSPVTTSSKLWKWNSNFHMLHACKNHLKIRSNQDLYLEVRFRSQSLRAWSTWGLSGQSLLDTVWLAFNYFRSKLPSQPHPNPIIHWVLCSLLSYNQIEIAGRDAQILQLEEKCEQLEEKCEQWEAQVSLPSCSDVTLLDIILTRQPLPSAIRLLHNRDCTTAVTRRVGAGSRD